MQSELLPMTFRVNGLIAEKGSLSNPLKSRRAKGTLADGLLFPIIRFPGLVLCLMILSGHRLQQWCGRRAMPGRAKRGGAR
ncbi:hypothetical protein HKCCE2091_12545 [Rhodobacterales bacterium HKCCE2091]|nr:hypothetical protein [Rhodobacterales bacterium HKCCE2091]